MDNQMQSTECCPRFNPEPWDGKIFEWTSKKFIKDRVFTFLFMPVNFGQVIARMNKKVESAGAKVPDCSAFPTIPQNGI